MASIIDTLSSYSTLYKYAIASYVGTSIVFWTVYADSSPLKNYLNPLNLGRFIDPTQPGPYPHRAAASTLVGSLLGIFIVNYFNI